MINMHKYTTYANNGTAEMGIGSFYGGQNGDHNCVGLMFKFSMSSYPIDQLNVVCMTCISVLIESHILHYELLFLRYQYWCIFQPLAC